MSKDGKDEFYAAYIAIFNLPCRTQKKCSIVTRLMGEEPWSWRVAGISPAALESLAKNDYKYVKGVVCRAHIVARIETARAIFEIAKPIAQDEFFNLFFNNDQTVITTKSENKTGGGLPEFIPIGIDLGHFQSTMAAWKHGPSERNYLRDLHVQYRNGNVALISPSACRQQTAVPEILTGA